jgi:hypothetical protein
MILAYLLKKIEELYLKDTIITVLKLLYSIAEAGTCDGPVNEKESSIKLVTKHENTKMRKERKERKSNRWWEL